MKKGDTTKTIEITKGLPRLTRKQAKFVKVVIETDNATEAASQAYRVKDRTVAKSMGSENLAKPAIRVYTQAAEDMAKRVIQELALEGKQETVRLHASKDILDRNIGKSANKIDVTTGGEKINQLSNLATDELIRLLEGRDNA